ncbi:MAG: hypothetical protein OHK0017_00870 [Patescibacteria group bacterium]
MPKKLNWVHGLIFFIVVNLIGFGWGVGDVQGYYLGLNKPWFAPATWVFGIAWTVNNILVITGNIWAYNFYQQLKNQELTEKQNKLVASAVSNLKIYGVLQILSWINFAVFQYLSFGTKIPSMFFWPTFSMWVITVVSMYFAGQIDTIRGWLKNSNLSRLEAFWSTVKAGRSIIFTFTTLIIWLSLASLLGYYVWMNN